MLQENFKQIMLEALGDDTSFDTVLKAHGYTPNKTHAVYSKSGSKKVAHFGSHVITRDEHDESKRHVTPTGLNRYLNKLHDHKVSLSKKPKKS